jgi:hypothetical protein
VSFAPCIMPVPTDAFDFADRYCSEFQKQIPLGGELAAFRASIKSLTLSSGGTVRAVAQEYHGGGHQVTFTGNGNYSRSNARCELADVAIISFSTTAKTARLTYLQAKYEKTSCVRCSTPKRSLKANLEQWDLLGRRPLIAGATATFQPPADLLSGALCPSVGSFGFFLDCPRCNNVEMIYSVAGRLSLAGQYGTRSGRLLPPPMCAKNQAGSWYALCCNWGFAAGLASGGIGTPLHSGAAGPWKALPWIASNVKSLASNATPELAALAKELLPLIDSSGPAPAAVGAPLGARAVVLVATGPTGNL